MKRALLLLFLTATTSFSKAQTPDWSSSIASIVYNNCSSCHHDGGIAPFSLMSYDDAVYNGLNMQEQVNARVMPPWPADPECSYEIVGSRRLSQEDITAINDWVNGGMPSGDLASAPSPPTFGAFTSALDGIDLTVNLPLYNVQLATDEYRSFVVHSGYTSDHFINQVEVVPGNSAIVHHVLVYYDPTTASYNEDMQDTLAGFSTNGANTPTESCVLIGGWVPGSQAEKLPSNMAYKIPANSDFVVEIHFAPGHEGDLDSTKINIKYCEVSSPRLVSSEPILYHYWPSLTDGPLKIPANTVQTFHEKSTGLIGYGNYSLLAVAPHMHLIGTSWNVYLTSPDNMDTTRLVCIPNWSFHWQLGYMFHNLVHFDATANYHLRAEATYDNTSNNPNNPNDPPVTVVLGEKTTDEMMVVFFTYVEYQPGDEEIILDPATSSGEAANDYLPLSLYPNPASNQVELSAWLTERYLRIQVLNQIGAVVKTVFDGTQPKGAYATTFDISGLPQGIYLVELVSGGQKMVQKLVKVN